MTTGQDGAPPPRMRVPLPRSSPDDVSAAELVAVLEDARGRLSRLLALLGDERDAAFS